MGNSCFVYFMVVWSCILLFSNEGSSTPCALKDLGKGRKVCVCNSTYCDTIERVPTINKDEFVAFVSSKEGLRFQKFSGKFSKEKPLLKKKGFIEKIAQFFKGKNSVEININTSIKYQKIMGFGGAFTDAAGINILSLSKEAQDHLLRSYFSEDGIEYNMGRVPIAGTDFSTHTYSYDDGAPDKNLEHFSLTNEDFQFKIPLIKRAKDLSKREIHLLTTSWSPPVWMKTNNAWDGFSDLKPEYYSTYAKYILRFFDEYKKQNITFWAVSTGNEPMDGVLPMARFNSLGWKPKTLANWIANYFGPQLRSSDHKDILLLTFDDQRWYLPWFIERTIKAEPKVYQYVDGFAVHWYLDFLIGDGVISTIHKEYPDKFILYTEARNGDRPWQKKVVFGDWDRGEKYITDIIQNLNVWVVGWMDWNLALSMTGGPNWAGNFVDSPILVDGPAGEFYKQPMFYAMGHVSKFIERDAVRVHVEPADSSGFIATAVQNPDGRVVVVLVNKNNRQSTVSLKIDNRGWINFNVSKKSFVTIIC